MSEQCCAVVVNDHAVWSGPTVSPVDPALTLPYPSTSLQQAPVTRSKERAPWTQFQWLTFPT